MSVEGMTIMPPTALVNGSGMNSPRWSVNWLHSSVGALLSPPQLPSKAAKRGHESSISLGAS